MQDGGDGMGEVSDAKLRERAMDIAVQEGREQPREDDMRRAREELAGMHVPASADDAAHTVAKPIPPDDPQGSRGRMAERVTTTDDERVVEDLVREGIDEAQHDLMSEAEKEQRRRNEDL